MGLFASLVMFLVLSVPAFLATISTQTRTFLQSGQELQVKLKGGESHEYEIRLLAGQFLYLSVEQDGIDITASLFDPQGTKLTMVDSLNGEYGPEPIVAIAPAGGTYKITVASGDKTSPAGQYTIKLAQIRTPMPGDEEHVAAERQIEAAMRLASERSAASLDAALDHLKVALQYYAASPDHY